MYYSENTVFHLIVFIFTVKSQQPGTGLASRDKDGVDNGGQSTVTAITSVLLISSLVVLV